MRKNKNQGFTLIELMIAITIIAIIVAIAYPNYQNYVKRTKRVEVQSYLMEISHKLASYKLVNRSYSGASMAVIGGNTAFPNSTNQTYAITLKDDSGIALGSSGENGTTWTLAAIPMNGQSGDGAITLTHTGQQCWYKNKDDATGGCLAWTER